MWCLRKLRGDKWFVSLVLVFMLQITTLRALSLYKPIKLQMLNKADVLHANETSVDLFKNKTKP